MKWRRWFNTFSHDDIDELLVDDALSDNDIIDLTLYLTVDGVVVQKQYLFGDTEERYHQPIDRIGLTPASRLQRSVGQRSEVWTGEEENEKWDDKERVENREGSLGYPRFVTPVFTNDRKPLGKRKRSLGHLGIVTPVLT
ncbi:hypothetical protein TNCV_1181991 [Trichonephila clavipes]|nr:hypothetical protein TNCV_1181991 [Trichonephila clavipes]